MNLSEIRNRSMEPYPENIWSYKVIRPLSCYPTWLFLKLGISANQATFFNLLVGLSGCTLLALGIFIPGALLINLNYLLDRVDGNIARMTNTTTEFGKLADAFGDFLLDMLIPISLGIGLYLNPMFGIPGMVYLLLGFTFSLIRSLRSRIALYTSTTTDKSTFDIVKSKNLIIKAGLIIVALEPILLLGFALGNILGIFLIGYTLVAGCELLTYTMLALRGGKARWF